MRRWSPLCPSNHSHPFGRKRPSRHSRQRRRSSPKHPSHPSDPKRRSLAQLGNLRIGLPQDPILDSAALRVDRVELGGDFAGALRIGGQQELESRVGAVQPARGVYPGRQAESEIMGVEPNRELRSYFERYEDLEREAASIAEDQRSLLAEVKANGFDLGVFKKALKIRARDKGAVAEEEALLKLYLEAAGG